MLELWAEILHFFFSQMIDTNSVNFKKIWGGGWNDCQTFMWNYTETVPEIREKATFLEVISKAIIYNFEAIDLSPTSLNHRWDLATIWKQDSCRHIWKSSAIIFEGSGSHFFSHKLWVQVKDHLKKFSFLCLDFHVVLTHLFPMHPFSIPWKHQKTLRFFDVLRE